MSNGSVYREAILEEALKFIGGTAVAIGIVGWLVRSLIKHFLDKDVELFRQSLQSQAAVELEKLKHELRLAAVSYEKQVTLLQEKRASVIAELYSKLIDFLDAAESFVSLAEFSGEPSKTDKAKVLGEKAGEFMGYFARNRIYFNEELCEMVTALFKTVSGPAITFRVWLRVVEEKDSTGGEYHKAWMAAWETMKNQVPPLRQALQDEFRALLGVTSGLGGK